MTEYRKPHVLEENGKINKMNKKQKKKKKEKRRTIRIDIPLSSLLFLLLLSLGS